MRKKKVIKVLDSCNSKKKNCKIVSKILKYGQVKFKKIRIKKKKRDLIRKLKKKDSVSKKKLEQIRN